MVSSIGGSSRSLDSQCAHLRIIILHLFNGNCRKYDCLGGLGDGLCLLFEALQIVVIDFLRLACDGKRVGNGRRSGGVSRQKE